MPSSRINFDMNTEEREFVNKTKELSREQMWISLERKRFDDLKRRATNLSSVMLAKARCPKCTL